MPGHETVKELVARLRREREGASKPKKGKSRRKGASSPPNPGMPQEGIQVSEAPTVEANPETVWLKQLLGGLVQEEEREDSQNWGMVRQRGANMDIPTTSPEFFERFFVSR